jgi:phage FluMu protein Com
MTVAASSWREPAPLPRMVEVRCRDCRRLLFKIEADRARVEIICPDRACRRAQTKLIPTRAR